ncbi:MAG: DMT family transporter [Ectothiorhodospiraceae bacterium]|nr:DMT family transporter [Ectothiorhodospiraceae bacterium]
MLDTPPSSLHFLGAIAALGSALCWALAAILFRRIGNTVSAFGMNLGKGIVATIFLLILLFGSFVFTEGAPAIASVDNQSLLFLALSGLVGICLGDTLYFATLIRLGPRVTLLMGSLIPVVTALAAILMLGERISLLAATGLGLTIIGVAIVLWDKAPDNSTPVQWKAGIGFGMLFVLLESAGIILTKMGVQEVPSLEATFIRQTVAIAGLTFWGLAAGNLLGWLTPLKDPKTRRKIIIAALIGALLGTWLSVLALKHTHASVAAALNSTSPLFVLPLAAYMMKERISRKAIMGAAMAVVGIAGYFLTITL